MYYLIYSSYAAQEFNDESLTQLLMQAREKNKRLGITGMLVFFTGNFIQLIEGEEHAVRQLGIEISQDTRHKHFMILNDGLIDNRFFSDWSMGFRSVNPENQHAVECFKELNSPDKKNISSFLYLLSLIHKEQ